MTLPRYETVQEDPEAPFRTSDVPDRRDERSHVGDYERVLEELFPCMPFMFTKAPGHLLLGQPAEVQGPVFEECKHTYSSLFDRPAQTVPNPFLGGTMTLKARPAEQAPQWVHELLGKTDDWRLLLQLDSDEAPGWMWGDVGCLYFCMSERDLRARRFDRVWMRLQCG